MNTLNGMASWMTSYMSRGYPFMTHITRRFLGRPSRTVQAPKVAQRCPKRVSSGDGCGGWGLCSRVWLTRGVWTSHSRKRIEYLGCCIDLVRSEARETETGWRWEESVSMSKVESDPLVNPSVMLEWRAIDFPHCLEGLALFLEITNDVPVIKLLVEVLAPDNLNNLD